MDVKGPDGKITRFPDDTPDAKVNEVMSSIYSAPAPKPKPDNSRARGLGMGIAEPFINLAKFAQSALPADLKAASDAQDRAAGSATPDELFANFRTNQEANTRTGYRTVGNILGTAPAAVVKGGAAIQGGLSGALLSKSDNALGVAGDAGIGAVTSVIGSNAVRGIGALVAPKVAPYIETLRNAGVQVTSGQLARSAGTKLGNFVANMEDRLSSLPVVGEMIAADRGKAVDQLNRAVVNRVLKPLGKDLPEQVATGNDAVDYAQQKVREAYQAVLPQLSGAYDATFGKRLQAIAQRTNLPEKEAGDLADIVKREVGEMFDASGAYTGKRLGQVRDRLDKLGAGLRASANTYEREMGEAVGEIRKQVLSLARRNNPGAAPALKAADTAHANLVRLENATSNTAEGIFTPGQLKTAVRQSDRSARKRSVAAGNALMQDLSKAAVSVLPSKTGDSGTFTRAAAANIPYLAAGALAAVPYKLGRAATPLLTRQAGPGAQAAGGYIRRLAGPVSIAAPALLRRPDE